MYPTSFSPNVSLSGYSFPWLFWKCAPRPCKKHTFEDPHEAFFNNESWFFDVEMPQTKPVLIMFFGHIPPLYVRFPVGEPHVPQVEPQKTSQKCVLLLQVSSLADFNDIPDTTSTTFSCMPCHCGWILIIQHHFHLIFHFPVTLFHDFSENVLPAYVRSILLKIYTTHVYKKSWFFDLENPQIPQSSAMCTSSWNAPGLLDPSKNSNKTNAFLTFSFFSPTKPAHISIILAI